MLDELYVECDYVESGYVEGDQACATGGQAVSVPRPTRPRRPAPVVPRAFDVLREARRTEAEQWRARIEYAAAEPERKRAARIAQAVDEAERELSNSVEEAVRARTATALDNYSPAQRRQKIRVGDEVMTVEQSVERHVRKQYRMS